MKETNCCPGRFTCVYTDTTFCEPISRIDVCRYYLRGKDGKNF
jgi:hypothetical protein